MASPLLPLGTPSPILDTLNHRPLYSQTTLPPVGLLIAPFALSSLNLWICATTGSVTRDCVQHGDFIVTWGPGGDNLADNFMPM